MATPTGVITMWSGATTTIPNGWILCDGASGSVPDLRGYFVFGAQSDSELGVVSGCATHSHTTPSLASGGAHTHSISGNAGAASGTTSANSASGAQSIANAGHYHTISGTASSGGAHTHGSGTSGNGTVLPPYYKLFYIMKDD